MSLCERCCLQLESGGVCSNEAGQTLCEPCARLDDRNPLIRVSPLTEDDLELVLAWRSNPKIYRFFRQQDKPLTWEEHISWFNSREPSRYDFVIQYDGRRVGVTSLDSDNEVTIYLGDFSVHGQGVATLTLNWLCHRFADRIPLIAEIHEDNETSKRLFRRCGFREADTDGEWLRYRYES